MQEKAAHTPAAPVLLMVSGGSDSMALLELAVRYVRGGTLDAALADAFVSVLPAPDSCTLMVLHVNHQLRGVQAGEDAEFVRTRCDELGVPFELRCADVAARAARGGEGVEAAARAMRYELADEVLDGACAAAGVPVSSGVMLTAHTLDDRIETFFMRSLVGTGPGGLGSIPRSRGRVRRPLLDMGREQLRDILRGLHPDEPDSALWRDDPTNEDGSNFRSQVRTQLMPVLRELRPAFKPALARTMDLIAEEDAELSCEAQGLAYRNLSWDGETAAIAVAALQKLPRHLARRVLRACLLVVCPDARLEAAQIDRVLDGMGDEGFATDVSGGIRVRVVGDMLELGLPEGAFSSSS